MLNRIPAKDTLPEVLGALDARARVLTDRDKVLLAEQIALENADVAPAANIAKAAPPKTDAMRLLDHDELVDVPRADRLSDILRERAAIKSALELAASRSFRLRLSNEATICSDLHKAWKSNIAATRDHVLALRRFADERLRLRSEYAARVGIPFHGPAGNQADQIVSSFTHSDHASVFLEAADRFLHGDNQ